MRRLKRATLTDVALRAGVSVTTASYILNDRSAEMRIAADTERRVLAAMDALDYRPNRTARTLRGSSTQTIALISGAECGSAFPSELLAGVGAAARQHGHLVVIGESMGDPEIERLLVEEMFDRRVDGILYVADAAASRAFPERLLSGRTVLLNCERPDLGLPAVVPDDVGGGRAAVEHLLAAGPRRVVHVVGDVDAVHDPPNHPTTGPDRMAGVAAGLAAAGKRPAGVIGCRWGVAEAYDAMCGWLRSGGRPEALVCLDDRVAMGTYQALAESGLDVPGDVSVISFGGSELASWLRPRLTSMALPLREMGAAAVELLLGPGRRAPATVRLPLLLQPGESVAGATRGSRVLSGS